MQVECHPYMQQRPLHSFLTARGVTLTAYAPLGSGDRPALLRRKEDPPSPLEDPVIVSIAEKHERTPAQVILRWLVSVRDLESGVFLNTF